MAPNTRDIMAARIISPSGIDDQCIATAITMSSMTVTIAAAVTMPSMAMSSVAMTIIGIIYDDRIATIAAIIRPAGAESIGRIARWVRVDREVATCRKVCRGQCAYRE
jgi:hypothetical protein